MADENSLYERLGGDAGIRALCERFYEVMDSAPSTQEIRAMHPKNLAKSAEKLYMFLSGWTGGPKLYWEKYGHPRLRARHLPFPINKNGRNQWIWCMNEAMRDVNMDPELATELLLALAQTADFMRNQPEDTPESTQRAYGPPVRCPAHQPPPEE